MTKEFMYNFQEKNLGTDFAKEKLTEFKGLISGGQSFTVVSMPGVGVSYFLKYLTSKRFACFVHVDLYSLPALTLHEFYKLLPTKEELQNLARKNGKVVIIFSRFDQLKKEFTREFFSNLQSLTNLAPAKIVLIFTSIKPLDEIVPEAIGGGNLSFFSKILYFKPYVAEDLKKLFTLEHTTKAHPELDEMIELSGGHNQLLHIFLNSQKKQNLLLDKFVKLQLKELVDYLDYAQRKQVQKIALGKKVEEVDEYLLGVGYVTQTKSGYHLFSPILEEYIKTNLPVKLPVKERALFNLLRKNIGRVVSKDEIFSEVWPDSEDATDWALDALIYRLRNSQFMKSHGYIIESHKKVGYTLIQV